MSATKENRSDVATNRLTLAYDVLSLAQVATEWVVVMAEESGGDTQEWLKAWCDEVGRAAALAHTQPGDDECPCGDGR